MYVARYTRADILFAVTYLATKTKDPRRTHYEAACRILRYLHSSPKYVIKYDGGKALTAVQIFADASHNIHADGKGHGGLFITLGSGYVFAKSKKLALTTLSSTESEGINVCDAITYAIWFKLFLSEIGVPDLPPAVIYQDNLSTIWLTNNDGSFAANKHMLVRKHFIREHIRKRVARMQYMASDVLPPDILTKPLTLMLIRKHAKRVGMLEL